MSYKGGVKSTKPESSAHIPSIREAFEQGADMNGASAAYIESLYETFLTDPDAVPEAWAERFDSLDAAGPDLSRHEIEARIRQAAEAHGAPAAPAGARLYGDLEQVEYPSRAIYLIHGYRVHGHLHAKVDPLHLNASQPSPELELRYYGLSEADLDIEFPTGDLVGPRMMPLREILAMLKQTYCGHIGPEFLHMTDSAQKHWLQERLENIRSTPDFEPDKRRKIYDKIMRAGEFERFLHTRYAGQKRFSLEGGESLIPMLDALVAHAGDKGAKEITLGMAHRGRLNVLANLLGKSLSEIFAEFEGVQFEDAEHGAGDVKYHLGFSSDIPTEGGTVHLSLAFNPSHLEIITPVVLGSVRARQSRRRDMLRREVMSVLVHGDAAFAGQGVVAESLNLSQLSGFRSGGTIHIVVNNQIGFTTNPFDGRSTLYCTDIAKMVQAPILHVNGDDPEAVVMAVELAVDFRYRFKRDVVIDLVCYRRHGHNEADAPEVTQPIMYRKIAAHDNVQTHYGEALVRDGVLTESQLESMTHDYHEHLEQVRRSKDRPPPQVPNSLQGRWKEFVRNGAPEPETSVPGELLDELARRVHRVPPDFALHPKIEKVYASRIEMMAGNAPIDWGCAETMAYAAILNENGWVRLSGQDSGRGTFFHRHAVVYDQQTDKKFIPLRQAERGNIGHFVVVDSMLSEEAVMAFEYGYSLAEPRALVIWEAQYGDFANNAQVVIDQFIAAGESKWSRMSGLVLWLPHGYEGYGAEHSSARLERFLQLCAEGNMQVVYPTTPAQLFHLLRRQVLIRMRKPLIMMGPKSLLRQKLSFSSLDEFTEGRFMPVLGETDESIEPSRVKRLLLCSGKVYYDLLASRRKREIHDVAIVRIERLYPFPYDALKLQTANFASTKEVVWVQEEPENQGAWYQTAHRIRHCLHAGQSLHHIARATSASPAVGSGKRHAQQQAALVEAALAGEADSLID
ncbi:MAG TPA: 2-oxoglutarate dehydrogenase E1 component [Mariprofundaceae bacterium]|nr:2-oxoglutarate dehydrogenase E1 component [Mariprofundaceae bacterium]